MEKKITWIVSESGPKATWSSLLGGDLKDGRSASQPSVGPPNLLHQELGRRCSGAHCGNSATASDGEDRMNMVPGLILMPSLLNLALQY